MYTHYTSFFFKYVAPATEIINKFWAQVRGVINLIMFLCFLSACDSYESRVSFEFDCTQLHIESPPHMCILMHLKKLCEGSPQFQANPTLAGRDLSKMLPLTIHGDGTPVCGAGKSWSKMGDFFSWSCMLVTSGHSQLTRFLIFMVHAYMRCPNLMWCRSDDSVCDVFLMSFVTSNTMFLSLLLHVSVLLFFISGARSLDETRWDVSST